VAKSAADIENPISRRNHRLKEVVRQNAPNFFNVCELNRIPAVTINFLVHLSLDVITSFDSTFQKGVDARLSRE